MNREEREQELTLMLRTKAGREAIDQLYERLYVNPEDLVPKAFIDDLNLVQLILAKEFPEDGDE